MASICARLVDKGCAYGMEKQHHDTYDRRSPKIKIVLCTTLFLSNSMVEVTFNTYEASNQPLLTLAIFLLLIA